VRPSAPPPLVLATAEDAAELADMPPGCAVLAAAKWPPST
jgi:hypothetical protein